MAANDKNPKSRELARRYAEIYGEALLEEDEALARLEEQPATPRMDRRVRRMLSSVNARHWAVGAMAVAAAALVLALPALTRLGGQGAVSHENSEGTSPPAAATRAPQTAAPGVIPLGFALPAHLSVADVRVDNGRSVYRIANARRDDIVMTLEKDADDGVFADLTPVSVNGSDAYYKYTPDFGMMAFERGGVTYVLTCRHDVNSLLPLAEAIL